VDPFPDKPITLAEAGIDKHLADKARKFAVRTREEFEVFLGRLNRGNPLSAPNLKLRQYYVELIPAAKSCVSAPMIGKWFKFSWPAAASSLLRPRNMPNIWRISNWDRFSRSGGSEMRI
jgi:hypothetical protein